MAFDPPSQPSYSPRPSTSAADDEPPPGAPTSNRGGRGWLLAVALLVAAPIAWSWGKVELGQWRMAVAFNYQLDDDLPQAVAWADRAVATSPDAQGLRLLRARLLVAAEQSARAVQDCDWVLQLNPNDAEALQQRISAAQLTGDHDRAIADAQQLVKLASDNFDWNRPTLMTSANYASALNTLAYTRAVAQRDLPAALQDINKALEVADRHPELSDNASFLDTRGYIQYLLNNILEAQADLDSAVSKYEGQNGLTTLSVERSTKWLVDHRAARQRVAINKQGLAVLYHHRALVWDALDLKNQARLDRLRSQELGYAPQKGIY